MSLRQAYSSQVVAIVGAGPAGLYAAEDLAQVGLQVVILNRDIKPGGLAEYGIYLDKYKMKAGLRKQFQRILNLPNVHYFGNVTVGEQGDLTLTELRQMGFAAVLVAVGAQGTKWLGLPGEHLTGVYHAKDVVYHYNRLPPFSEQQFAIGRRAAVIGVGNVMADIAHWLIREKKVAEVTAVARRGPADVKFTKKELEGIAANLDLPHLEAELGRVQPMMERVGQDVHSAKAFLLSALPKAEPAVSDSKLRFAFMYSPKQMLGDESGRVTGLELEATELIAQPDGSIKVRNTGQTRLLEVDNVIFAIGDRIDATFGLPLENGEYVKNPAPRFPIEETSYEAYDLPNQRPYPGVFVAGWARQASTGLVGVAKKDGKNAAAAMLNYLETVDSFPPDPLNQLKNHFMGLGKMVVDKAAWLRIEAVAEKIAQEQGLPEYKFAHNSEMLAILQKANV